MKYRTYKDLEISEVSMGCYALSGSYGSVDSENYKSVLNHSLDLGINLFDTAAAYGEEAERIMGEVVKPIRKDVIVSTKIGMNDEGKPSLAYDDVKSECKNSLERLNTEYIDIYLVHFDDPDTPVKETVEAFDDLKDEGKIKHYGVSHLPLGRVEKYLKEGDVSFCLVELSAVSRQARKKLLPLCDEYGSKAIAFSVTGRGLLTGKIDENTEFDSRDIRKMDPLFKKERFRSALRIAEKLGEIGKKYDRTSTQVAINWVLAQENIISALTGPSSKEHLEENVEASGWDLKKDDLREIESFLDKEDEILEEKELEIINEILKDPLSKEIEDAFNDLVYVMEVAMERGMAKEKEIIPIFRELMASKKKDEKLTHDRLEDIRRKVKTIIE